MWIEADVKYCEKYTEEELRNKEVAVRGSTPSFSLDLVARDSKCRRKLVTFNSVRWVNTETNYQLVVKRNTVIISECSFTKWNVAMHCDSSKTLTFQRIKQNYKLETETGRIVFSDGTEPVLKTFDNFFSALEYAMLIVGETPDVSSASRISNFTRAVFNEKFPEVLIYKEADAEDDKIRERVLAEIQKNELFRDQLCDILHTAKQERELNFYLVHSQGCYTEKSEQEELKEGEEDES